ncbi:MAG: hypothetical protein IKL52_00200 [Candidatus Gastranaerophilales bacterium]|nr:hypothetical protein [Candidatus Gastranaerophilales bacterium]
MKEKLLTFESGKAKEFFLNKLSFMTNSKELHKNIQNNVDDINIIDVREYDDYIDGHIPFAIHIPLNSLEEHLVMLHKDRINVVYSYCPYCKMALHAAYQIAQKGFPVMVLAGGYKIWCKMGYDTIKTSEQNN